MSLRRRIILTLLPLFVLFAALGAGGVVLLSWLGGRIDLIMRENYQSILAMADLDKALDEIDDSFQVVLAGRGEGAAAQFESARPRFWDAVQREKNNITLPGEKELVDSLYQFGHRMEDQGRRFHQAKDRAEREQFYFASKDQKGLRHDVDQIKQSAQAIVSMNQDNMELANKEATEGASRALTGFSLGLFVVGVLAALVVGQTIRIILRPIESLTRSSLAIGQGNLDQVVPVVSNDELGKLADAFNLMARQLRHYRQSHYQQLLRAQRTSQATIDSLPHPVVVVDSDNQVSMANPAARRQLGVLTPSGTDETKAPASAWLPPEPLRKPIEDALRLQKPYLPEGFSEALAWRSGDQDHYFLPRVLPIQDPFGGTLGAAVLLEDVTRFRMADQIKTNLAATVSHELKTPLASLQLALHVLKEESIGPLSPKQMELVLDARENADRLLALVNELLDLARLEEGGHPFQLQPERPVDLLSTAADLIQARARDKQIHVVVEASDQLPAVAVDADRLGSAIHNLLINAITYTDPGGTVTLRAMPEEKAVVLSVSDTGCGIPREYLPHVFDKFFRVPGQREAHGTGLGLAIVREVVEAHGGTVTVESEVGKGTTFQLRFPVTSEGSHGH